MKFLLTILLPFVSVFSFAQEWQGIPKTNISYTNFKNNKYQYFKKGDSLIVFPDSIAGIFYTTFLDDAKSFNEIFSSSLRKLKGKQIMWQGLENIGKINDSTILVLFALLRIKTEHNEVLFELINIGWDSTDAYTNIHFKKHNDKKKVFKLKYLYAERKGFDI